MRTSLFTSAALIVLGIFSASASANLLTDPGFESNPMGPGFVTSLGNFPAYQNQWNAENGNITGPVGAISPSSGSLMAEVFGPSTGTTSQLGQIVDISAFAGIVDANQAQIGVGELLNSDAAAAIGGVYVNYYTASNNGSFIGSNSNVINLDNLPSTWEGASFSAIIPAGTRWIQFQAAFDSNSITGVNSAGLLTGGFVDDTFIDIKAVPEPTSVVALGAATVGLLMRRRSRR